METIKSEPLSDGEDEAGDTGQLVMKIECEVICYKCVYIFYKLTLFGLIEIRRETSLLCSCAFCKVEKKFISYILIVCIMTENAGFI